VIHNIIYFKAVPGIDKKKTCRSNCDILNGSKISILRHVKSLIKFEV